MPDSPAAAASSAAKELLREKLVALRAERGNLSQHQAAQLVGMETRQYQKYEANSAGSTTAKRGGTAGNPTLDTIFKLAIGLEVEIDYLVNPARKPRPVPPRTTIKVR